MINSKKDQVGKNIMENLTSNKILVDDLPTGALNLAYDQLMAQYIASNDNLEKNQLQTKLVALSEIINDKSYSQIGHKKIKEYFIKRGSLSEHRWNSMTEIDRQ